MSATGVCGSTWNEQLGCSAGLIAFVHLDDEIAELARQMQMAVLLPTTAVPKPGRSNRSAVQCPASRRGVAEAFNLDH